ncbi:stage II sporulation protein M [Alicyclobacillus shizuokensis]|uniref:stage II sporulation protein M n=1 Tax=Alicyclobacillus shizuokensis TaxID=392014 RepID=UPI00082A6D00|nr:stage II sporulation protein M [Alicyclobacillus shizuokensis]
MLKSKASRRHNSFPWFIALALLLLVVGYISGMVWPHHFQGALGPAIDKLKRTAEGISSTSLAGAIWTIFFNNALAALELIILGVFLGVFPALMLWLNGVLLGYATALAMAQAHVPWWKVLLFAVLPHGVFELTAIIWAAVLGFQLGFTAVHSVTRRLSASPQARSHSLSLRHEWTRVIHQLPWILGLLLVAACIEAAVTPRLIAIVHL